MRNNFSYKLNKFFHNLSIHTFVDHALDQFLEGILSIMDSLNINPYGKLVRVGGQSKVEDIQQYNIRNIRSEYLRRKQFDENYAQLRFRTRRDLMTLEDYRSDLKSLFADLSNPEGIVNFRRLDEQIQKDEMSDDFRLASTIHGELGSIFLNKNGATLFHWLQMNFHHFESHHFSAENILKNWFRISTPTVKARRTEVNEEVDTPETEFEDEELRNILVAHRMEEEILEEDRKYKAERLEYHFCYKQEEDFKSSENELFCQLQDARNKSDDKNARSLEGQLYELGLQRNKFMNQCEFMQAFLRSYQDGRIDLPTVTTDLLSKANEQSSVSRLSLSEKWAIYFHFIDKIKKYLLSEIIKKEAAIMESQKKMEEVKNQGDGFILQKAQIVGMTTTGAAKYNTVLRMMKSKIGNKAKITNFILFRVDLTTFFP